MKKSYEQAVAFANFCIEHNLCPADVSRLASLSQMRARAYNSGLPPQNRFRTLTADVETTAKRLGLTVSWSGLFPTIRKGNRELTLPLMS